MKSAMAVMTVITTSCDLYVFDDFFSSRHSEGVLVPFVTFARFLQTDFYMLLFLLVCGLCDLGSYGSAKCQFAISVSF